MTNSIWIDFQNLSFNKYQRLEINFEFNKNTAKKRNGFLEEKNPEKRNERYFTLVTDWQ